MSKTGAHISLPTMQTFKLQLQTMLTHVTSLEESIKCDAETAGATKQHYATFFHMCSSTLKKTCQQADV